MKKGGNWMLIVLLLLLIPVIGLRKDINYCRNTAASIHSTKVWGITLSKREEEGFRGWLKDEIGLELESDYVDYLEFHPLIPSASTPPGNWLNLRRARQIYEDHPSARPQVKEIVLRLAEREVPSFEFKDRSDLDALAQQAAQRVIEQD